MVLAVLTMVLMALMLLVGFNITHSIHERIRIQAAADAHAYSSALIQARVLNVNAYMNRTIAAMLVAQNSMHAWMAIATQNVSLLYGTAEAMLVVAAIEVGMGCYPFNFSHCPDVIAAVISAFRLRNAASKYWDRLTQQEDQFNQAIKLFSNAIKLAHLEQKLYSMTMMGELIGGGVLEAMRKKTAPKSETVNGIIGAANAANLTCALEGADLPCVGVAPLVHQRSELSREQRHQLMRSAANAARMPVSDGSGFHLASGDFSPVQTVIPNAPQAVKDNILSGLSLFFAASRPTRGAVGDGVESVTGTGGTGAVTVQWRHGLGVGVLNSEVTSDDSSGNHRAGGIIFRSTDSNHGDFDPGCSGQDCFVGFRADGSADSDFGQPTAFGLITQNLRKQQLTDAAHAAYELNSAGRITFSLGPQTHTVQLIPRSTGVAVSKAKAYYHQVGASWQLQPNAFDPFWRAKLHPLKRDELMALLMFAGDQQGMAAASTMPVEGDN
jgi:hypothetical protein